MSVSIVDDPLDRLRTFPNLMNWKGEWIIGEQYYQNDIVKDPNGGSYILNITSSASGLDPAMNPDWTEFSGASTALASLQSGNGISIDDTDPAQPVVNNEGVITVIDGVDITTVENPPHTLTVTASGITQIFPGAGIEVTVDPHDPLNRIITNTGVLRISVDTEGLSISESAGGQIVTLANTGVLSLVAGDGIAITAGQIPRVSNDGVVSIIDGNGVVSTGTADEPILNCRAGRLSLIFSAVLTDITTVPFPIVTNRYPDYPPVRYASGVMTIDLNYNFFAESLETEGTPGGYLLDFSSWLFEITQYSAPFLPDASVLRMTFVDGENNTSYRLTYDPSVGIDDTNVTVPRPVYYTIGKIWFDFADAYASGIRTITGISFENHTLGLQPLGALFIQGGSGVWGTYYPSGIQ